MDTIKSIWNIWKGVSRKIGDFQANIIFSILYFLLVVPIGVIANFLSDFYGRKSLPSWDEYSSNVETIEDLENQY